MKRKQILNLCIGPLLFVVCSVCLKDIFSLQGARAMGMLVWMVYWWVTGPVSLSVTAGLPIVVNALFQMIPMEEVLKCYASSSLVLIFGSGLLSTAMEKTGLDHRIALMILACTGSSMVSQTIVWFCAGTLLSVFMPNVAVCALLCPLAVAMIHEAGYESVKGCPQAAYILLAIGWGAGIGGAGSPVGGAMNITAISCLQSHLNMEYMYIRWLKSITPYMIIVMMILLGVMLWMVRKCEPIHGTKEYFTSHLRSLGKMNRDEIVSGVMFVLCVVLAFARPLYADVLPSLEPAYVFLLCGGLMFVIPKQDGNPFLSWDDAQKHTLWGMMILFGGGIALGGIVTGTGVTEVLSSLISKLSFPNLHALLTVFVILASVISELTNSTVSASVLVPVALSLSAALGIDAMILWTAVVIGMNAEFLLPVSIRAIPVSYGADEEIMFRKGMVMFVIRLAVSLVYLYVITSFFPGIL